MARKRVTIRPAVIRPVAARRSIVNSEVRIYQELIKLASERNRVEQEERMWTEKGHGIGGQLQSIDSYRKSLFDRLVRQYAPNGSGRATGQSDAEKAADGLQEDGDGGSEGHETVELKF